MDFKQILHDYWKKGIIFLAISIIICSSFLMKTSENSRQGIIQVKQLSLVIEGDVNQPGTYQVPSDLSLAEAINQFAKGVKEMDDPQVHVSVANPDKQPFKPILINLATVEQIQNIPGVGPSKAKKIIDYRLNHGPFKNKEALMEVSGFGQATVEKMLPYIDFALPQ